MAGPDRPSVSDSAPWGSGSGASASRLRHFTWVKVSAGLLDRAEEVAARGAEQMLHQDAELAGDGVEVAREGGLLGG